MTSPYLTDREKRLHAADCGKHAARTQAFLRLYLLMEYDEDAPAPLSMTHRSIDGTVFDILQGPAALPSAGDEEGTAAVDRFAAKHHVPARWDEDGRYRAVIVLGGGYLYEAFYLPERNLHSAVPASREPELAGAA